MMRWPARMVLAAFAFAASVQAQENVPDPDGYRTYNYRAPVPATLAGARVLTTPEAVRNFWMSWNAAKRILSYGYSNVAWYPEGTEGWERANLPVVDSRPLSRAEEGNPSSR
jgi:hypothetical protein